MNYRAVVVAAAQAIGLYAAGFLIPLFGQIVALLTPVPIILAYRGYGRREGLAVLLAAGLLSVVLGGWQAAALFFGGFGLMAIGIGEGIHRRFRPESVVLIGGLLPVAFIAVLLSFYFLQLGKNPLAYIDAYMRTNIAEASRIYTELGLKEMAATLSTVPDRFLYYLVRLLPAIVIATSLMQAACCYGFSRRMLLQRTVSPEYQPFFALWYAPDAWVYGLIAALALLAIPGEPFHIVGWNCVILTSLVYLIQGSAIVEFYLVRARINPFFRGMIITMLLMLPAIVFIIALGVVDVWADVRKLKSAPTPS